jgi:hypothetical protein
MVHFRRARRALRLLGMRRGFVIVVLILSGCAVGNDCATNAFELGQRDGVLGSNQGGRYASACGSSFDAARYTEGFRDGFSRRPPPQGD